MPLQMWKRGYVELVAKMLEVVDKEWFSEYVWYLLKRGKHIDGELSVQDLFTNEMNIKLNMFCTRMKYRIVGKGDITLVITPHY